MLKKIAHNSTMPALGGNRDLRPLQDLITAEKAVLMSLQKLSVDLAKASDALKSWGMGEGDDLGDTLNASTAILQHFSAALTTYASHEHTIRDHMKTLRTREEALDELKRRRKTVVAKADSADKKLSKMSQEHKNRQIQMEVLIQLQEEIRTMDTEIMIEEAKLGDFKRTSSRAWMALKFGGLLECSEKGSIAGEFGKLVITEIPEDVTEPGLPRNTYAGHTRTASLIEDAQRCISEVVFSPLPSTSDSSPPRRPGNQAFVYSVTPTGSDVNLQQSSGQYLPPVYEHLQQGSDVWAPSRRSNPFPSETTATPITNTRTIASPINPIFLPPAQDLGQGHFIDPSDTPSFSSNDTTTSMAIPQVSRSVDDFGVNNPGPAASGKAGRFATFPVKTSRSGGPLRTDPGPQHTQDHFAPSVGGPSGQFGDNGAQMIRPDGSKDYRQQRKDPGEPLVDVAPRPMYERPLVPPPSVPSLQNPWNDGQPEGGETMLPHTISAPANGERAPTEQRREAETSTRVPGRLHVRFGEVSDVEEELERREMERAKMNVSGQKEPLPLSNQVAIGSEPPTPRPTIAITRIPPPAVGPESEERALNAAAAREISRELDSLTFNPPPPINQDPSVEPEPVSHQSELPPPTISTEAMPNLTSQSSSPHNSPVRDLTFSLEQDQSSYPITLSSTPQIPALSYPQTPPLASPISPDNSMLPNTVPQQQQQQQHPRQQQPLPSPSTLNSPRGRSGSGSAIPSPSPSPSPSPYRTPPEYPRNLGSSAAVNKISSSLTPSPSPVPGTRTISAAAFKRPPRVTSSQDSSPSGVGRSPMDPSPLMSRKRTLPSSPYPLRLAKDSVGNTRAQQKDGAGVVRDPANSNVGSGYRAQGLGQGDLSDAQQNDVSPIPVNSGSEEEELLNYISAYVNPPVGNPTVGAAAAPPYGQGKFMADFDSGLR